jgi:L-2-hydroxyglutarate oxidase
VTYDYAIIGGGILGLTTAQHLLNVEKDANVVLFEKEDVFAKHQTGHNSGVIHAGVYYEPGSLKAKLCREGLEASKAFCDEHKIAYNICGKLIVATNSIEEARIDSLYERAKANGLKLKFIDGKKLRSLEPNIRGTRALLSPETGIVDYHEMAIKMATLIKFKGVVTHLNTQINRIIEKPHMVELGNDNASWKAKKLIVCGGLQADRLARMAGMKVNFRIVPFRGEYFKLPQSKNRIIKHLIYPAPDPTLPFLGVHLTRMIDGSVTVGPNAVLSFAREGYPKLSVNIKDIVSYASFGGFWKLIWQHRSHALHELQGSLMKSAYLKDCQKYCPILSIEDLLPYRAGIRAQVVTEKGKASHDFLFGETNRMLHVFNAPSPAATSAIPIGKLIAEKSMNNKIN